MCVKIRIFSHSNFMPYLPTLSSMDKNRDSLYSMEIILTEAI